MEFLKHTLANGLEIVAEASGEAYSTSLGYFVKAGARDETDEISGVSHFLEHMAFKGTPTRSADDVNRRFDEIGAHYNAGVDFGASLGAPRQVRRPSHHHESG